MTKQDIYPIPADLAASAHIDAGKYSEMYQASVSDPEGFWRQHGQRLDWMTPYSIVKNTSYAYDNVSIKWFEDGVLNVCANCVDRHVETRGDQVAIVWEGDDPAISENITYRQLYDRVRRVANVLKRLGVGQGRSRHSLYADDPGSRLCDARLRTDRRGAFDCVRWLFSGRSR